MAWLTRSPGIRLKTLPSSIEEEPESQRFRLFEGVAARLRTTAASEPMVVILDDLHAADEPSLLLLQFVASELADAPIVLLAIYRDPELGPEDGRQAMLTAVARAPNARHIRVASMSDDEVSQVVERTTGRMPDRYLVDAIISATEGNPLFITEMSRLLADEGRLGSADVAASRLTIPASVKAVIGRRLDRLSADCRSTLRMASVVGRDFNLELVTELGIPRGEVIGAVDEATAARVVQDGRAGFGRWRFAHVLMRDVLYESLPLAERISIHDRVGRALERLVGDHQDDRLSELAHHFVAAAPGGDVERAVRYSKLAGDHATASSAHEEAVRHYRTALGVLEMDHAAAHDAARCDLLLDLGEALMRAGLVAAGRDTLLRAGALAEDLGLSDRLAFAALGYGGRFVWERAGVDMELVPFLHRALKARGGRDDVLRVRLLARLSGALRGEMDMAPRDAASAEALTIARRLGDPMTLGTALNARQFAISGPDALDEMERLSDELDAVTQLSHDRELIVDSRGLSRVAWRTTLGMPAAEMQAIIDRTAEAIKPLRQPGQAFLLSLMRTNLELATGQFEGLEERIRARREEGRRGNDWGAEVGFRLALFALARERDELGAVLPLLRTAGDDLPGYWVFQAALPYAEAETGDVDSARRHLKAFARNGYRDLPHDNQWLWSMMHLGEAAMRLGDDAGAAHILDGLTPYSHLAGTAAYEVIAGPVGRVVGELASSLRRFDDAEVAFRKALTMVERTGWRPWEAWTRWSYAVMLARRALPGDGGRATEQLATAAAIVAELGMPALARRLSEPAGLVGEHPGDVGRPSLDVGRPLAAEPRHSAEAAVDSFRREGDVWAVTYDGRTIRLRDSKGLRYLRLLLAAPGREVAAVDLLASGVATAGVATIGGPTVSRADDLSLSGAVDDPLLDAAARAEYRDRLLELQAEIDEATRFGDSERAERLRGEFEFVTRELMSATGLGGRTRGHVSSAERARQSVTKAIRESIDRIERHDAGLGAHLRHALRTGVMCSYVPDPRSASHWLVSPS